MPAKTTRITAEDFLARAREMGLDPKPSGDGYACRCPAHDDRHPSLTFAAGEKAELVVKCHRGENPCSFKDIMSAMGFDPAGAARTAGTPVTRSAPRKEKKPPLVYPSPEGAIAAKRRHSDESAFAGSWPYHDAEGLEVMCVTRWNLKPTAKKPEGGKEYLQLSRRGNGWVWRSMSGRRPLYGQPALKDATRVLVVEGEKCADCLRDLGFVATTSSQGAGSAHLSDWSPLAGKAVVGFPDNDAAGESYMNEVAKSLSELSEPTPLNLARLPGLPSKGDVVDLVASRRAEGKTDQEIRGEIEDIAASATPLILPPLREVQSGKNRWTPVPASQLKAGDQADWVWIGYVARGCATLLTGGWKSGKTTLISDLVRDLTVGGPLCKSRKEVKVLIVSEEGPLLWKRRVAQRGLSDRVMFICRPFTRRAHQSEWEEFLRSIRDDALRHSCDLVIVDTLSTLWPPDDENDAAKVQRALLPLTDLLEAGIVLLLINHPKKGDSADGMASRGSGALPSWVDCILEFHRKSPHNLRDTQRVLKALSRFDETCTEVLLERGDNGYELVGEITSNSTPERLDIARRILEESLTELTAEEVHARWPGVGTPSVKTISALLSQGAAKGHWELASKGARGKPACYRPHASVHSSRDDPPKGEENHPAASTGGEVTP